MMSNKFAFIVSCALICLGSGSGGVFADEVNHRYTVGDPVPFYTSVVGPFHNIRETYHYSKLPYCFSENATIRKDTLGEILKGGRLVNAPYKVQFRVSHKSEVLCKKKLTKEEVAQLRSVIDKDYYFQMYFDDLPLWGFVGSSWLRYGESHKSHKYRLYKSVHFDIFYNDDRVIEINCYLKTDDVVNITEDREVEVEFMYSVTWEETSIPFEKRMEKYVSHNQFQWFSTMNSCVIVLLLTGLLVTILIRVLKNDFIKYTKHMELTDDQDESGWKNIHGDVFRFPEHKSLFAASIGCGTQLLALTFLTFIPALFGVFQPYRRPSPVISLLLIYAITSVIAGYTSTSFYVQLEGTNWVRNIVLTGFIFSGPLLLTFCFLNAIATAYGASAAILFSSMLVIILVWVSITFVMTILGGIAGKSRNKDFQAPCRTTKCIREIPLLPWYRRSMPQMAVAGVLPFCAIYNELYYIFACLWGHRFYTAYVIFLAVFIILLIVTAFITVALTYFQLASEDHQWWWRSLFLGGSTGLYVYGYCLYYYFNQSYMSGLMQTSFFFGYMTCICLGIFLMLGTAGFYASLAFVRYIYGSIKCD